MRITYDAVLASSDHDFIKSVTPSFDKFTQISFSVITPDTSDFKHIFLEKKIDLLVYDPCGFEDIDFFNSHLKDSINYIILIHDQKEYNIPHGTKIVDNLTKPVKLKTFEKSIQKVTEFLAGEELFNNEYKLNILMKDLLKKVYFLSPTESCICISIAEGKGTSEVLNIYGITINTYKTHMKKIYKKTIDLKSSKSLDQRGKFQQLLWFLINLKQRIKDSENPEKSGKIILRGDI